jgi:dienelactone hydrolase
MKKLVFLFLSGFIISINLSAQDTALWDMKKLAAAPRFTWINADTAKVREIIYKGEPFGNIAQTDVFAYYSTPGILAGDPKLDHNLPAVVLVHGGGGKAFKEWVILWAKRGYAAIAMDLSGNGKDGKRLPNGGPDQGTRTKYNIDSALNKQWVYHSVANVILAHSLINSFHEVDPNRTAITGISWGGFLTCIVTGIDERFKVAVPVYGCGYIDEPGGYFYDNDMKHISPDVKAKWTAQYGPEHYIGKATMPFLWVNGTKDPFYPPNIFSKTYNLVKTPENFRLTTDMVHGHEPGWAPNEIGLFIDHYLIKGKALPIIAKIDMKKEGVQAKVKTETGLAGATLSYTIDTMLPYKDRKWITVPAKINGTNIIADAPPANTTIWILNATDDNGSIVSSSYQFGK